MRIIDQESRSGKIIRAIGMGVGISVALANERASYKLTSSLIKNIFGGTEDKNKVRQTLSKMRTQKILEIKKVGNEHKLVLAEGGQEVFLRFNYEDLAIKQSKIWDRQFRMVIFDIPEKYRSARDSLREKLKELGLVKFNDSVWVYPYPCQKEIDFIANYWKIGRYVHFVLAKDLTNRETLEKFFCL